MVHAEFGTLENEDEFGGSTGVASCSYENSDVKPVYSGSTEIPSFQNPNFDMNIEYTKLRCQSYHRIQPCLSFKSFGIRLTQSWLICCNFALHRSILNHFDSSIYLNECARPRYNNYHMPAEELITIYKRHTFTLKLIGENHIYIYKIYLRIHQIAFNR